MSDENEQITVFAKTNFRNKEVPFGIKTDDRRRHMYLIGKTGMGKTTLMENMVIQDIRNGHGVAFLDPHGDSVQRILNSVPNYRVNDVIYFNPADLDYPVAFNILESVDPKYKHLVASGLMGVFTKIWANLWSARMEYILNNTILALLDSPGNTLLGITRMYVDKKYRKKIVDNIRDPMVKAFWTDEFANYNEKYRTEAIAPIQNKVGQFLSSGIIRNIVGQPKSTIDLREIMDQRKILIMDLSKGKVGEDNSALLGAMIVTKLQLAAMSRTDIPEHERKDFYLYVDEFQNFATESFATILSEARKYRLNLIVGHQYISQLEQDKSTKVRDAIFGNVGTMVLFRIGAADAEFLETEFEPIFTPNDLVNLPKYHIILKLMINGVASEPFSAVTMPPSPEWVTENGDKVIKVSRERYANPRLDVEDKISRWMGAEFHQEVAVLSANVGAAGQSAMPETLVINNQPEVVVENVTEQPVAIKTIEAHNPPEPAAQTENAGQMPAVSAPKVIIHNSEPKEHNEHISEPPRPVRPNVPSHNRQRSGNAPHKPGFPHSHRGNDRQRQTMKPKNANKKENPIWGMVAELNKQKIFNPEPETQTSGNIGPSQASNPPEVVTEAPVPEPSPQNTTPIPHHDRTVIKPGQTHKF